MERYGDFVKRHNEVRRAAYATEKSGVLKNVKELSSMGELDLGNGNTFQKLEKLGSGSYGDVYGGTLGGRPTVAKVARFVSKSGKNDADAVEGRVRTFFREATVHALIGKNQAGLCKEAVACATSGTLYVTPSLEGVLLFDWHESQDLADWISKAKKTPRDTLLVCRELFRDVISLHSAGLAHLDLKPENILVVKMGEPERLQTVLIDLGFACTNPRNFAAQAAAIVETKQAFVNALRKVPAVEPVDTLRSSILTAVGKIDVVSLTACSADHGTPDYFNQKLLGAPDTMDTGFRKDLYALGFILAELAYDQRIELDGASDGPGVVADLVSYGTFDEIHPALGSIATTFINSEKVFNPLQALKMALALLEK